MNVLIIGGARFIGLATAKRLTERGHKVTLYHRFEAERLPFAQFKGDMGDEPRLAECLRGLAPDCVIHMRAMNGGHVETLKSAVNAASVKTPRVLIVSSGDVYKAFEVVNKLSDAPVQPTPFAESSELRSVPFAFGRAEEYEKKDVETAAFAFGGVCARLGMVYGENDYQRRFTDVFEAMRTGSVIEIPRNLAEWRGCYTGVNNAAHGLALLAEKGVPGEAYNLAGDDVLTELEWRQKIAAVLNWRGEIRVTEGEAAELNFKQNLILDTSKIKALGYRDIFTPEEELAKCPRI